jgi:hypothetical protein
LFGRLSSTALVAVLAFTLAGCVNVAPAASSLPASRSPATPVFGSPSASASAAASQSTAPTGSAGESTSPPSTAAPSTANSADNGAGSIAYIKDGNVWLAAPDGSSAHPLTTDGEQNGYHDPSQAPDGTIYALQGSSTVVAIDRRTGANAATPVTLVTLENGAEGLSVAPDGAHYAYTTTGFGTTVDPRFGTPNGAFIYGGTDVATVDGTSVPDAAIAGAVFPTWLDAITLVVSDGTKLYDRVVGVQPDTWLDLSNGCLIAVDCPAGESAAANLTDPSISRDGKMISAVVKPYYGDGGRLVGTIDAPPPAVPGSTCMLPGQQDYSDPGTFAPDSSAFAYDDTVFDPDTLTSISGQGIYVVELDLTSSDCGASAAELVIPGGAQPDWGAMAP